MIKYYRKTLISLFQSLNNLRNNPTNIDLCFSIQERLLNHIRRIEYRIRKIKSNNTIIQNLIKNGRLPKEESKKLKQRIEYNILKKNSYDRLLLIFRDVGDGIAFTYLDKWDIKPLCVSKETSGFISGKKGIRLELAMFRKLKRCKFPFIFNDVTNSIRYCDITIIKHGIPIFFEAKSGRSSSNNERSKRQMERINKISEYIKNDKAEGVYPGYEGIVMERRSLMIEEKHYRKKLNNALEQALRSRINIETKIEKGLHYGMITTEEPFENIIRRLPKNGKWLPFFVNEEKQFKRAYYPFTLSIINPDTLFAFYLGKVMVVIFINFEVIKERCREFGINAEFYGDEEHFIGFVDQGTQSRSVISRHFFGRIYAEFLSLEWLISESCNRLINFRDDFVTKSKSL